MAFAWGALEKLKSPGGGGSRGFWGKREEGRWMKTREKQFLSGCFIQTGHFLQNSGKNANEAPSSDGCQGTKEDERGDLGPVGGSSRMAGERPGSFASLSSASQEEGKQGRPQDQEGAGGAGRGSIAKVSVAAVDPDPWQLLLLAVTGGGTSTGQKDPQHRCQGQRRTKRKLRAAATLGTCADSLPGTLALGLHGQLLRSPPLDWNR